MHKISKSRLFKLTALNLFFFIVVFTLLNLFAPHLLQRFGTTLGNTLLPTRVVELTIATAARSGNYYRMGCLLRDNIRTGAAQVLETQGTLENLALVSNNKVNFAFVQGALPQDLTKVTAVARIGQQFVHVIVPTASEILNFKQLAGKTLSLGPEKSGHAMLGGRILEDCDFRPAARLVHTSISSIREDFASDRMDAIILIYDLNAPLLKDLLRQGDYRLIPLFEAEAMAYSISGLSPAVIPHGAYGPNRTIPPLAQAPFPTLAVNTLLVTPKSSNRFQVQSMLQTLYSPSFLKRSGLPLLNENYGQEVSGMPLHEAATRYYRRNAAITADHFEIGSALLAGLLFLGNIWTYLRTRANQRRQALYLEKIVPYFKELLTFSESMARETDPHKLKHILDSMMATQNRAEAQWLKGELDTEHMENLYMIYGIRSSNTASKILRLQTRDLQETLKQGTSEPDAME